MKGDAVTLIIGGALVAYGFRLKEYPTDQESLPYQLVIAIGCFAIIAGIFMD